MKITDFKKFYVTLVLCLGVVMSASAQDVFLKGDKVVNLGVGFGSFLTVSGAKASIPPIGASFEYGIVDGLFDDQASIGVGGYFGFVTSKWQYSTYDRGYRYTDVLVGVRANFHYQFVEKLDTYGGVLVGYDLSAKTNYGSGTIEDPNYSSGGAVVNLLAGARYYFTDQIAVFGEVGYGISAIELGLSYKF